MQTENHGLFTRTWCKCRDGPMLDDNPGYSTDFLPRCMRVQIREVLFCVLGDRVLCVGLRYDALHPSVILSGTRPNNGRR